LERTDSREVRGDERIEGPVEKPCRNAIVLSKAQGGEKHGVRPDLNSVLLSRFFPLIGNIVPNLKIAELALKDHEFVAQRVGIFRYSIALTVGGIHEGAQRAEFKPNLLSNSLSRSMLSSGLVDEGSVLSKGGRN
jgi:hypothetical protein